MNLKGKKIIVVEDEEINIYLLKALLSKTDAELTFCGDADEFFREFNSDFDLILLDLKIPGEKNGKDIIKEVRENSSTPIIVQSAYVGEEKDCKSLGANDFVHKPILSKKLFDCIKKILKIDV